MRTGLVLAVLALTCGTPLVGAGPAGGSGSVRFFKVANSAFDRTPATALGTEVRGGA